MIVKTETLTGSRLDWAVSIALGYKPVLNMESHGTTWRGWWLACGEYRRMPRYHSEWSQGGPIIERESIAVLPPIVRRIAKERHAFPVNYWRAMIQSDENELAIHGKGPTPLIAAMRCLVASKLGDTIEIPDNLLEHLPC